MNSSALPVFLGNTCAAFAVLIFLWPLQKLIFTYSDRSLSNNEWTTPVLFALIPLWLLLMGGLLCVTANGGFDWWRLGRTAQYVFSVGAAVGLGTASLVIIGLFVRPGFTPRFLYWPPLLVVHLATLLVVVLSLNQKLGAGVPIQWLRWPWTVFAAVSMIGSVFFFSHLISQISIGGALNWAYRYAHVGPSTSKVLAQVAALDPDKDFTRLLDRANRFERRAVREAAAARLRSHSKFLEQLSSELERGQVESAVMFVRDNPLTRDEQKFLAGSTYRALERWVHNMPASNYTTKKRFKELRSWGEEVFDVIPGKFTGTGVDFGPVMEDFKDKAEANR